MNTGKFIGSCLILIGTTIGAGMLALPLVSGMSGFLWASMLMIIVWALMTITGLLVLEVNLAMASTACSFSSMADKTIGNCGKIITWITYVLLLYALTAAYMSGAASLLSELMHCLLIQIPNFLNAVLFTLILGGAVFWSTKATDYLNRGLISIKGLLLIVSFALLSPRIGANNLLSINRSIEAKYFIGMLPIFLCAFGYHTIIPSLRMYIGDRPRTLAMIIVSGTSISLLIYLLWLAGTLGVVPLVGEHSFTTLEKNNGAVGELLSTVILLVHSKWLSAAINGFSDIAMATSFLGVTLGLFDFLADGFKRPDTRYGRAQTALLTFIPPLIFAFCYPRGFILALNYAAIFITILGIILPALMAYKLRTSNELKSNYKVFGGNMLLMTVITIGVALIGAQIFKTAVW